MSDNSDTLPIELRVTCDKYMFASTPVTVERWAPLNYFVGANGSGKTTFFSSVMESARSRWPNRVKILGTGRLGPLEKSVSQWLGDITSRLFQDENIDNVYGTLFSGQDTAHQAFQLLEKRLDLQIRVLGFLRHVFKRSLQFKETRRGLLVMGASANGNEYQLIDECHGLKELVTLLTFLYDDTFSVLGIDEPELHLHPQFQRYLLDELKAVAGSPDVPGRKLIFLVTHSPILLEFRTLADLASVTVFAASKSPRRATAEEFSEEERLKVRQILPSFHSGQREFLFSSTPFVVEGARDAAVLLNVATRLQLPLGAAGIGVVPMGGKYQLLAFRALARALGKEDVRFVLDLDAALDTKTLHCLDSDPRVMGLLASKGLGDRTLTKLIGELIGLLREYARESSGVGMPLSGLPSSGELTDRELVIALQALSGLARSGGGYKPDKIRTILGKLGLVRDAARAGSVLILSRGAIEAYYSTPLGPNASEFDKQQALQGELDKIWGDDDATALEARYSELLSFFRDAGFIQIPMAHLAREKLSTLVHLLQSEIRQGRLKSLDEVLRWPVGKAEGFWYICTVDDLQVSSPTCFSGRIRVKESLGGETIRFDETTRAYELLVVDQAAQLA